ncbi:MAG: hypothetical protein KF881_14145 [Acidobacteria bacterium]|nr:hypothetical protein [Acidobacteriota bacterium]
MASLLIFDMAPVGGGLIVFAVLAMIFAAAAIAFIAYKVLAKTVKMTARVIIAAVMFLILSGGGSALWYWTRSEPPRPANRQPVKGTSPR